MAITGQWLPIELKRSNMKAITIMRPSYLAAEHGHRWTDAATAGHSYRATVSHAQGYDNAAAREGAV